MIVCICHRVSDRDIAREVKAGCRDFGDLQEELRVATGCGACTDCARQTFDGPGACGAVRSRASALAFPSSCTHRRSRHDPPAAAAFATAADEPPLPQ